MCNQKLILKFRLFRNDIIVICYRYEININDIWTWNCYGVIKNNTQ